MNHQFRAADSAEQTRLNALLRDALDLMPIRLTCCGGDSAFVEVSSLLDGPTRDARSMTPAQLAKCATRALDQAAEEFAQEIRS